MRKIKYSQFKSMSGRKTNVQKGRMERTEIGDQCAVQWNRRKEADGNSAKILEGERKSARGTRNKMRDAEKMGGQRAKGMKKAQRNRHGQREIDVAAQREKEGKKQKENQKHR